MGRWLADLLFDLRYALRAMRRSPGIACLAVLTLAFGIGSTTAVFSLVNAVLLAPFPYPNADRLVFLAHTWPGGGPLPSVSAPKFLVWRDSADAFDDAAAYSVVSQTAGGGDRLEQLGVGRVSAAFFRLFGAQADHGRLLTDEDDVPGAEPVVVLAHAYWQRAFASASDALDRALILDGEPHRIIGVLDPSFDPRSADPTQSAAPDVWVPLRLDPGDRSDANLLTAAARLRPGITLAVAEAQTAAAVKVFRRTYPGVLETTAGLTLTVVPLPRVIVEDARRSLALLLSAGGLLLLLVCANVACLLLVKAESRQKEFAIRAAAGADRGRLRRQLLTESLLLACAGGALGGLAGAIAIRAILAVQPLNIPRVAADGTDLTIDWRVLLLVVTASAVAALLTAAVPARRAASIDVTRGLKATGGIVPGRRQWARAGLVIGEVAIAATLLVGAALLMRSMVALVRVDPGFDGRGVTTLRMALTGRQFAATAGTVQHVAAATRAVHEVPGVDAVAASLTGVPPEFESVLRIGAAGRDDAIVGGWHVVTPGFFAALRAPIVRGRAFADHDDASGLPVVIINEALAQRLWPDRNPIGERVTLGEGAGPTYRDAPREIVGVVGNMRYVGLQRPPRPAVYIPLAQLPDTIMALVNRSGGRLTWVVRGAGSAAVGGHAVTEAIEAFAHAPVTRVRALDDLVGDSMARRRFEMGLVTLFGGAALLLATLGVYGVVTFSVEQRRREIGIRIALGAAVTQVRRTIVAQSLAVASIGLAGGLALALAAAQLLSGFLYGVTPYDGIALTAVPVLLGLAVAVASWLPARRATRLDPAASLRE